MDKLIMAIATGLGLGYLPVAPGTWGTLLAFPVHFALKMLTPSGYGIGLAAILLIAIAAAGSAEKILDRKDPGVVVIDEVAGMLVALIGAPDRLVFLAAAFLIFRFFDIVKPMPIRLIDRRINGGIGIVADDLAAGLFTLLAMQAIYFFAGVPTILG